jgi:hypothetical protein
MTWKDRATERGFVSFDGGVRCTGRLFQPDNATDLTAFAPTPDGDDSTKYISRGAGMSFAAASFGDKITSIDLTRMNHVRELLPKKICARSRGAFPSVHFLSFFSVTDFTAPSYRGTRQSQLVAVLLSTVMEKTSSAMAIL